MEKVCGIVAEFNPFHNGHAALIEAARNNGAEAVVAVMSGNFVQRASPAITDKRVRARAALEAGVDLVIELPLPYATATAQFFARGAVGILRETGIVDTLAFGSECGDIAALGELAAAVDLPGTNARLREILREGVTFARARERAVAEARGEEFARLLSQPNNALAIEYLRQAAHLGWDVDVFTIGRLGSAHDSDSHCGRYASASYLRRRAEDFAALEPFMPEQALQILREAAAAGLYPADGSKLDVAVLAALRRLSPADLAALPDLSEGLEHRLYAAIRSSGSLDGLHAALKSKRYTMARARRLVLAAFLGITRRDVLAPPPYIRVLGFGPGGPRLLRRLKQRCGLPCSASLGRLAANGGDCARFAALEELATDLYGLCLPVPAPCGYERSASGVFGKI